MLCGRRMQPTRFRWTALLLALSLAGCADRSLPPPRTSPEPDIVGPLGTRYDVIDLMRAEPTWFDASQHRVFRFHDGNVEPVQDRELAEVPTDADDTQLRVFDDGSIAMVADRDLYLYPASGDVLIETLAATEVAIDGESVDDLYYVAWFVDGRGYRLCHRVAGASDCSVELPNVGGYTAAMALGPDGAVYVTDRDETVYRYADGALSEVGRIASGVLAFRRGAGSLLALGGPGLFAVDQDGVRQLDGRYINGVVGSETDYYVMTFDSESVLVDPSCRDGWSTSCERTTLWSQMLYERVHDGASEEIGHVDCVEGDEEECASIGSALGLDGDRLIIFGTPLRTLEG